MTDPLSLSDGIIASLIALLILVAWAVAILFAVRNKGLRKANWQYSVLLLIFAFALLNNLLAFTGAYPTYRFKFFVPLWYTLTIGPCLFFFVKFSVYPSYRLRWTDAKHFVLPLLQALFYLSLTFSGPGFQQWMWDHFLEPFYKTFEGVLFVISFFTYLAISYRYVKYKKATLRRKKSFAWEHAKATWMQWTVKFLFYLAALNTFFVVSDFLSFQLMGINLNNVKSFAYLNELSFAAMLFWLLRRGIQYALGTPYPTPADLDAFQEAQAQTTEDKEASSLEQQIRDFRFFADPEIRPSVVLGFFPDKEAELDQLLAQKKSNFFKWINALRKEELTTRQQSDRFQFHRPDSLAVGSGYSSLKAANKAMQ
jgi:hypothetical protein